MKISKKFAPVLFSALLSAIMTAIVSAFVIITTQGLTTEFLLQWFMSCLTTWPIAFPTVLVVAPWVRRIIEKVT